MRKATVTTQVPSLPWYPMALAVIGSPWRRKENRSATRMARAVSADFSRRTRTGEAAGCRRSEARTACETVAFMGEGVFYRFAAGEERQDGGRAVSALRERGHSV